MANRYIIDKKICKSIIISTAIAAALLNAPILKEDNNTEIIDKGHEMYNAYSRVYLDTISELDKTQYDEKFIDIYRNGKYYIDEIEYDVSELYIVTTESGENHIIKAGENKYDILTKQTIEEKKVNIQCLRNTSIFYTLYQDGLITSKEIKLDKNVLAKYIKQWDGQNQYEVPELIADKEARDYIRGK